MPGQTPHRDTVLAALARLMAWADVARSPQLSAFLNYIVQNTLDGNEASIKAYSIAVDVFGRPAEFDPQTDPIVRVQARRLRALLDQYYAGEGQEEAVQIVLPVGRYIPEFRRHDVLAAEPDTPPPPVAAKVTTQRSAGVTVSWFVLLVVLTGLGLLAYSLSTWGPRQQSLALSSGAVQMPSVTIVEFQDLSGETVDAPIVAGLALELVTDLELFETLDVRYGGDGLSSVVGDDLAGDYVLTGIVRVDNAVVQYSAILTDTATRDVVWNYTVPVTVSQSRQAIVLDQVSKSLSLALGSMRGPLHAEARTFLQMEPPLEGNVNLYLCRVLFDLYREGPTAAAAERANLCLRLLPASEQQTAAALAMDASLLGYYVSPLGSNLAVSAERNRLAGIFLDRAIAQAPVSSFVWEQMARLEEERGKVGEARADFRSSLQLNPANGNALAEFARLLAFDGRLAEAFPMANEALNGTPNPPPWYHGVPALSALRDGDYAAALNHAEFYTLADREVGPILSIIAGQAMNQSDLVNRYITQVLDQASFRSEGILVRLRERISDELLLDQMAEALATAGIPSASLTGPF